MGVKIEVEASGLAENLRLLQDAQRKLANLKPVLTVTAEKLKSLTDESFIQSKAPDGTAWAPLAPSTVKQKLRKGYSPKPLIRRGARGLMGAPHATAGKQSIKVGVSPTAPHGRYHQEGRGTPSGHYGTRGVPRRAFLPFTREGVSLMKSPKVDAIIKDMEERLRKYLFGE